MDYKEKLERIATVLGISLKKEEALADQVQEQAPVEEAAPAPQYVTVAELSAMKDEIMSFKSEIADMVSKLADMMNATEKNTVPVEASAEVVEEEVIEEEVEELSAVEPMKHDPEANVKNVQKVAISAGRAKTTEDIVFAKLAEQGLWN